MRILRSLSAAGLCLAIFQSVLLSGPVPAGKPAHYPDWWFEQDVIARLPAAATKPNPVWPADYPTTDDFAVANIGQLKFIFSKAAAALNATVPNGAGAGGTVNGQVTAWQSPPGGGVSRDDFSAVNQGQLKSIAQMIYKRLRQTGYFGTPLKDGKLYPWGEAGAEDAYAVVNLGQMKHVFSFFSGTLYFDAYRADNDLDGMPDGWETEKNLNPSDPADAALMVGGKTNLQIYQEFQAVGGDPVDANPVGLLVYSP